MITQQVYHLVSPPRAGKMEGKTQMGDLRPQYCAAIIANLLSFVYGLSIGWTSPMQPILQATAGNTINMSSSFWDSGVQGMTTEQFSWVGAIICVGGAVGTPIYGYLADMFGRKKALISAAIPFAISYGLIAIATDPIYFYVARTIAGLGGAGSLCVVPMYIGETAEDSVRGALSSFLNLFICAGILVSYIVGSYTSYMFLALFSLGCIAVFLILALWLPESPVYCLINNNSDDAFQALTKLRGNHPALVQQQLKAISTSVNEMASNSNMSFKDMLLDPPTRKALVIALTLMTMQQTSGVAPIINYTVAIFEASGSKLSPTIAAIIVGALQIVGAFIGTMLMDKAGRKLLLMLSSVMTTLTLSPIAYFFYLKLHGNDEALLESIGWLPVTCMAIFIVTFGFGFGPVPFVLVSELFKTEARSRATSLCVTHLWIICFVFVKFFNNVSETFGIDTCFAFFAICCAGAAFFTFFYVVETKGKPLETILQELDRHAPAGSRSSPVPFLQLKTDKV